MIRRLSITTAASRGRSRPSRSALILAAALLASAAWPARGGEESPPPEPSLIEHILGVPLFPLRLVDAVVNAGDGVKEIGDASQRFADTVETMPQTLREQVSLSVAELEQRESVSGALDSFARISHSADRLAAVAEGMPQTLREQAAQVDAALERADRITATVERTTHGFAEAGAAWEATLQAFNQTVAAIREPREAAPARESSFEMKDVVRSAEGVTASAAEMRLLVREIHSLLESDALGERLVEINASTHRALDHTSNKALVLADRLTWRLMQLILLVAGVLMLYRLVCSRLTPRDRPAPASAIHHAHPRHVARPARRAPVRSRR